MWNRVNVVYNVCKLEIKIIVIEVNEDIFIFLSFVLCYCFYLIIFLDFGIGDKDCIGNVISVINGVFYLLCEYFNFLEIGYYNFESLGV